MIRKKQLKRNALLFIRSGFPKSEKWKNVNMNINKRDPQQEKSQT